MNPLRKLLILLAVASLVSCGKNSTPKPEPVGPVVSALQSGHWKRVGTKPPTYFPTETPADHPTDHYDGFWVDSGDSQGTRFFIPARGTKLPQEHLIAEAQETMTPEAKEELKRKGREIAADDVKRGAARGIAGVLGAIGQAMASMPSGPSYNYKPPKKTTPTQPAPAPPAAPPSGE